MCTVHVKINQMPTKIRETRYVTCITKQLKYTRNVNIKMQNVCAVHCVEFVALTWHLSINTENTQAFVRLRALLKLTVFWYCTFIYFHVNRHTFFRGFVQRLVLY